jgi:hypothetical protein
VSIKQFPLPPVDAAGAAAGIPFKIGDQEFIAPAALPAWPLMELAAALDLAEDESATEQQAQQAAMAAWVRFMHSALGPEQYGRFRAIANRHQLDAEQVMGIAEWLIEAVTGAPLEELSSSLPSPGSDTPSSTVASPFMEVDPS